MTGRSRGVALSALGFGVSWFALVPAALALDPGALPSGGSVSSGSADFDYSTSSELHINQHTNRVVIDWNSFNIGQNALTEFHQPGSSSVAVNRVTGAGDPTQILGTLKANGTVMVLDQNGVIFGQDSVVDVGSIIVSTGDIDEAAFMAGGSVLELSGVNTGGAIVNHGTITVAEAGLAAFVAPSVVNHGLIEARLGKVVMATGTRATLDLYGDGLIEIVADEDLVQRIENSGTINAGHVTLTTAAAKSLVDSLINVDGMITATAASQDGGTIVLHAPGSNEGTGLTGNSEVHVTGTLDASGSNGGHIGVLGDHLALYNGGSIKADGTAQGGTIRVGGEYLGGGTTPTAKAVFMSEDATISANGQDGEVILWSDEITRFYGTINANHGFVETSSKQTLIAEGIAYADTWLLDPNNITIQNAGGDTNVTAGPNFDSTDDNAIVTTASIEASLNAGTDVIIQTTSSGANSQDGDITLTGNIDKTTGGNATLTLQADRDINLNSGSSIISTNGALNVVLNADRDANQTGVVFMNNSTVTTNGGNFTAGGGANPLTDFAYGFGGGANDGITLTVGATVNTGAGNIVLNGRGANHTVNNMIGIQLLGGSTLETTTGNITLNGTGGVNGSSGHYGVYMNGTGTAVRTTNGGDITITGQGGGTGTATIAQTGVLIRNGSQISTAGIGGDIVINGTGGTGTSQNDGIEITGADSKVSSDFGSITLTGIGGTGTAGVNYGVSLVIGAQVESTGTGINAANITLNGTGGTGTSSLYGVSFAGSGAATGISTIDGDVNITGQAGNGSATGNIGISFLDGDAIATGDGNITINGTGGAGTASNYGSRLGLNSLVQVVDGDVSITGTGASAGASSYGVFIDDNTSINSTGTGTGAGNITVTGQASNAGTGSLYGVHLDGTNGSGINTIDGDITINGDGGDGTLDRNYGVYITDGFDIVSTGINGHSNINITGVGGNATDENHGIHIDDVDVDISAITGAISLTGTGGDGSAGINYGMLLNGPTIRSTGTGVNAATITLNGTGGTSTASNFGISMLGGTTLITSVDGNIDITATGGNGTGNNNLGMFMNTGSTISSTGTTADAATITVNATAGNGVAQNYGLDIVNGATITSAAGDIDITASSGATVTGNTNYGILLALGGIISSTGTGANAANITINATGGDGFSSNTGFYIDDAGTLLTTVDGDINITATGGSGGAGVNHGLNVNDSAQISSTGITADAGTITINGTGGNGTLDNYGVYINLANNGITSVTGDINITANGGDGSSNQNFGLYLTNGSDITSTGIGANAANITINSTGGDGISFNYGTFLNGTGTTISSVDGDIDITSQGGNGVSSNYGFYMATDSDIISSGTGNDAANITINGTGTGTTTNNYGVYINGAGVDITTIDGDVSITGQNLAGTSGAIGIRIGTQGSVLSTGTGAGAGNVTLNGTGGVTTSGAAYGVSFDSGHVETVDGDITVTGQGGGGGASGGAAGVYFNNSSGYLRTTGTTADAGNITVTGTGGVGNGAFNAGVYINTGGNIQTDAGTIDVTGNGGSGSGNSGYGVWVNSPTTAHGTGMSSNTGAITVTGTGGHGGGSDNYGFFADTSTKAVTSVDGNITVTGQGGNGGTTSNHGIYLEAGSIISSTGATANTSTITLNGTGGNGTTTNHGVFIEDAGTLVTTIAADIDITGLSGSDGTNHNNYGIYLFQGADITSTGTGANAGAITLDGTGSSNGRAWNYGVYMNQAGTEITSVDGDITITGQGGGDGTSVNNTGIYLANAANIESTGTGANAANIILTGTAGTGTTDNRGIEVLSASTVTAVDGDVTVTGTGGSSANGNYGVYIQGSSSISTTGTGADAGNLTLTGNGGAAAASPSNHGVFIDNSANGIRTTDGDITVSALASAISDSNGLRMGTNSGIISNGDGNINITMAGGGTGVALRPFTGTNTIGGGTATGDITLILDDHNVSNTLNIQTTGDLTIAPYTVGETIGVGGGAGTLNLSDTFIGFLTGNNITIGRTDGTGAIDIDSWDAGAAGFNNVTIMGGALDIAGLDSAGTLLLQGDSLNAHTANITAVGNLTLQTRDLTTSIGLGGGAGDFNVDDTELALLQSGGTVRFGQTGGTGAVTIDSMDVSAGAYATEIIGGAFTINGGLTGGGTVFLQSSGAGNDFTLNGPVTAVGGGNSLIIDTEGEFINNAGAGALVPGAGRWLVYANSFEGSAPGGLSGTQIFEATYDTDLPGTIPGPDNTFIFAQALQPVQTTAPIPPSVEHQSSNAPPTSSSPDQVNLQTLQSQDSLLEQAAEEQEQEQNNNQYSGDVEESTEKSPHKGTCLVMMEGAGCVLGD